MEGWLVAILKGLKMVHVILVMTGILGGGVDLRYTHPRGSIYIYGILSWFVWLKCRKIHQSHASYGIYGCRWVAFIKDLIPSPIQSMYAIFTTLSYSPIVFHPFSQPTVSFPGGSLHSGAKESGCGWSTEGSTICWPRSWEPLLSQKRWAIGRRWRWRWPGRFGCLFWEDMLT